MKHKLILSGLAVVLSLSPTVAMAGTLEKPVQSVSLGDCVNPLYSKPKKNYFIAKRNRMKLREHPFMSNSESTNNK